MAVITEKYFIVEFLPPFTEPTTAGYAAEQKDGVALSEAGRLCNLAGGKAKKFKSAEEAESYLKAWKHNGKYRYNILTVESSRYA